ncbi:AraC-like DNA-binding protein [Chryseobacterium defluvii]|uniref:AraC-like DNA-binding protein n=1 Tax=Chryseobacterium defluvii TaxID=160396 RepID=A0A840KJL4_9FLAO|nr:helix-turn-helix domain-containing protein [Chryseobacterium defluvii]MBB4807700.1 AraC-like DNA-binding protein [Chryseobacterium defluvii]
MNRIFYCFLLFILQLFPGQSSNSTEQEIKKQYDQLIGQGFNDQNFELIKKLTKASEKSGYKEGILRGKRILSGYHTDRGELQEALDVSIEAETIAKTLNKPRDLSMIYTSRGIVYKKLGFTKEAKNTTLKSLEYANKIENKDFMHVQRATVYQNLSSYFEKPLQQDSVIYYMKKSLSEAEMISNMEDKKIDMMIFGNMNIGNFYTGIHQPQRLDLAEPYYLKALTYRKSHPDIFSLSDLSVLGSVGRFYLEKGDYKQAIQFATETLEIEKSKKSLMARLTAYMVLANSYEELNDQALTVRYTKLYSGLSDTINAESEKTVEKRFQNVISTAKKENKKQKAGIITLALAALSVSGIIIWLYWLKKNRLLKKKYEAQIKKLEKESTDDGKINSQSVDKSLVSKTVNISEETITSLLSKLEKFEKSNKFIRQEVNFAYLANHLNTNSKYLSEILKQYRGKTFSQYINDLRINYILQLLYKEPKYLEYKISYLAEECGFSSRVAFTLEFKKVTGLNPSYFIENLKKDRHLS